MLQVYCSVIWDLVCLHHFQVIIQWETNSAQMPKQKKLEESRTSALRFCEFVLHHSHMVIICFKFDGTLSKLAFKVFCTIVGRQKFVREVLNAAPLVCGNEEEAERERLHFYRPSANKPVPEEPVPYMTNHQAKPSWHNTKKRQRQSKSCDSSHPSPPTKRLSSSALSAEDIDLLNSYWGMHSCHIPQTADHSTSMSNNG